MSRQDAGTQAADKQAVQKAGGRPIEADEAERLASMIRPAWELDLDEGQLAAIGGGTAASQPEAAAVRLSEGGLDIGTPSTNPLAPPRDTVIDGMPTLGVGETDPGRTSSTSASSASPARPPNGAFLAALAEGAAIVDRGVAGAQPPSGPHLDAPRRAGPTKLGLGESVAAVIAASNAPPSSPSTQRMDAEVTSAMPVRAEPRGKEAAGATRGQLEPAAAPEKMNFRGTVRMDRPASSPPPAADEGGDFDFRATAAHPRSNPPPAMRQEAPPAHMGSSFSRAEDPIEIPVKKGPSALLALVGLTLVVGAVAGGVMFLGTGDEPRQRSTRVSSPDETEASEPAEAPRQGPATSSPMVAQPTTPSTSEEPSAAPSAADPAPTATAAASTATTEAPANRTAPPRTATPPPRNTGKLPAAKEPPKPPPPKGTGGIIRDTPF